VAVLVGGRERRSRPLLFGLAHDRRSDPAKKWLRQLDRSETGSRLRPVRGAAAAQCQCTWRATSG
jgi:hypothetical protein